MRGLGAVCADLSACSDLYTDDGNSWMVATGNKLTAANAAYNLTHQTLDSSGRVVAEGNLTLAQQFAAAGLSPAEISCWLAREPSYLPEMIDYNSAVGCGLPSITSPGASPYGTNYPATMPGESQAVPTGSSIASSTSGTVATSACSFALFGETSCFGPIGSTTALVIGVALLALFMLGGKH